MSILRSGATALSGEYGSGERLGGGMALKADEERRRNAAFSAAAGLVGFACCLGVLLTAPADGYWINDCGNKALMAERLLDSNFRELAFDYPAAAVDPTGGAFPIAPPFSVARDGKLLSVYPPAYAALSAPFLAWLGPNGLRIPAAAGVGVAAALLAFWLSAAVGAGWGFGAGVVMALATPLFFYGVTLWEHSLTVALSLSSWVLAARPLPLRLFAAGAALATACWFRIDVALMGIALALAVLLVSRRVAPVVWLAAGAALPVLALGFANSALYGSALGPHLFATTGNAGAAASGLRAETAFGPARVAVGLLAGFGSGQWEARILGLVALGTPTLGWAVARRRRTATLGFVGLCGVALAAWALGAGRVFSAQRPLEALVLYNGLLVQLPLFALAGFGAERVFGQPQFAGIRVGTLAGVFFLVFVVVAGASSGTGYAVQSGFGVHWGPRVLLPAMPALVAFAVAAVWDDRRTPGPGGIRIHRMLAGLLVVAGLLSSIQSILLLRAQKNDARNFQSLLAAQPARYVVTTHPLLAQHIAPLWHRKPMLLARDLRSLGSTVAGLRAAGTWEFSFVVPAGGPPLRSIEGLHCRVSERYRGPTVHYFDLDIQTCTFERRGRRFGLEPIS